MIQRCPNCGSLVKTDAVSSEVGIGTKAVGGVGGAVVGSIFGNSIVGAKLGVDLVSSIMRESTWEFCCPDCGHNWTCDEDAWNNNIKELLNATPILINFSREEQDNHIKILQAELSDDFVDNYKSTKKSLYEALAFSQLLFQNDVKGAQTSLQQSLELFPFSLSKNQIEEKKQSQDSELLAFQGMIAGVSNKPYDDYQTMKKLINYKDIDDKDSFAYIVVPQFAERFDTLTQNYVNRFVEIPVNYRRFLVVDDELRFLPESFVVLPNNLIPRDIRFPSGHPRTQELYVVHPHKHNEYIPYNDYQLSLFSDELREFSWVMECLGAKSISFRETQLEETNYDRTRNARTEASTEFGAGAYSGSVSYKRGSASNIYKKLTSELMEAKEYCITPDTPPFIPQDVVWYRHRSEWHRNCESRKAGRLSKASFQLSTSSISATSTQEKKKIEADLKILLFKANGCHEQDEQISLRSEENHTWSVDVEFYPLNEYNVKKENLHSQPQTMLSSSATNSLLKNKHNYTIIAMCIIIVLLVGVIVALI